MKKQEKRNRLYKLSALKGYKVASYNYDIRGWNIYDSEKEKLGQVTDFIVDVERAKVRYVVADITDGLSSGVDERYILIPAGYIYLHPDHEKISVRYLNKKMLRFYPVYEGETVSETYAHLIKDIYLMLEQGQKVEFPEEPSEAGNDCNETVKTLNQKVLELEKENHELKQNTSLAISQDRFYPHCHFDCEDHENKSKWWLD